LKMASRESVPSALATGGAGHTFEQHVDAHWLALLLVGARPPIAHDCAVVEVAFQTAGDGWATDDFLITTDDGRGTRRRLAGQVKLSFTVSASSDECKKTILGFWSDFNASGRFSPLTDRLLLVVSRATTPLVAHFRRLLECARSTRDAEEFERRLATPGFINQKAVDQCDALREIVGSATASTPSRGAIWPFLRVLNVLNLDVGGDDSQTESSIKTLLQLTSTDGSAEASWDALLRTAAEGMARASRYRRGDLPADLLRRHSFADPGARLLRTLAERSQHLLARIQSTIGPGLHLPRATLVERATEQLSTTRVVLLSGPAGCGKSAVAKVLAEQLAADHFVFCFRAAEFAQPTLDAALQSAQVGVTSATLAAVLAGQDRKILLVESLERLLERDTRDAFSDLLALVSRDPTWQVLITCRDYSTELVRASLLQGLEHVVVPVPLLSDEEMDEVTRKIPALASPLSSPPLRRLL